MSIARVRLLAGDTELPPILTDSQVFSLVNYRVFPNEDGDMVYDMRRVAADYASLGAQFYATRADGDAGAAAYRQRALDVLSYPHDPAKFVVAADAVDPVDGGGGSGISLADVRRLIVEHAGIDDAHHVQGGGEGGGLSQNQVDDLIDAAGHATEGDLTTHEQSRHNHDQIARADAQEAGTDAEAAQDRADAAYALATTAAADAETAQDDIDEHEANHPTGGGGGGGTPHIEQRVLHQDHPISASSTERKFIMDLTGEGYITEGDNILGVEATGDFANFTHANYIGELQGEPNPNSLSLNEYYFLKVDYKLRRTIADPNNAGLLVFEDANWSDLLGAGARYRGHRASDSSALHHVSNDGDVYYNTNTEYIRVLSNYVAGSDAAPTYTAKRLAKAEDIPVLPPRLFVQRSLLPDPTATGAPPLVELTHDHTEGNRADATIIVGFRNGVAGYSNGELNAAIGSINIDSPLLELFGLGGATDYLIESIYWGNEDDIAEAEYAWINGTRYTLGALTAVPGGTVWLKRINDYPTGLSTANLSFNLQRFDETWLSNDSADALLDAGLYQLTDDGQGNPIYDITPTRTVTHRDSVGPPTVAPKRAGVIDIDDLGRIYASAGQVHRIITPPTGLTIPVHVSFFGTQYVDNVSGFADLADRGGLGAWFAQIDHFNFIQITDLGAPLGIDLVNTFHDIFNWIIDNVNGGDTPANVWFRDNTTMLGLFHSEDAALLELQFVLSGEAFVADEEVHQYYYVDANHTGPGSNIRQIFSFNPGQFLRQDDFHWNAQADKAFVTSVLDAHEARDDAHHTHNPTMTFVTQAAYDLLDAAVQNDTDLIYFIEA